MPPGAAASADGGTYTHPALRWAAYAGTRLTELILIVIGLGFTFGSDKARSDLAYLLAWDLLAVSYLGVGTLIMRRRRGHADPIGYDPGAAAWLRLLRGPRFNFYFTLAASLVGMSSAGAVIAHGGDTRYGHPINLFGAIAIVCAWMLLQAGYARFYAGLYYGGSESGPGLEFPHREHPTGVDFMYFSFTLGTSFAVSDVTVSSPTMRWHVMAHSVIAFFYNAIVLALVISIMTGR